MPSPKSQRVGESATKLPGSKRAQPIGRRWKLGRFPHHLAMLDLACLQWDSRPAADYLGADCPDLLDDLEPWVGRN